MRKLFSLVAALGLMVGTAGSAQAVVLPLAAGTSLSLQLATLPPINLFWTGTGSANVTFDGGGNIASVSGLTGGIFLASGTVPVTDPAVFPIVGVALGASATSLGKVSGFATNGAGNFAGVNTVAGGGLMGLGGVAGVCLFSTGCGATGGQNLIVPFTINGVRGIGLGGQRIVVKGAVNVTVNGNPWTTGTVSIGSFSASGAVGTANSVTLVTPTVISTNIAASAVIPSFASLTLKFVPEPGTLLLLASGVAGLAVLGRKRMSK